MLNHIVAMGRLTKDPEIRYTTQTNKPVASFTIACDRDFGSDKITDFIECTAWNSTAEFVQKYFQKGSMAVVSGRLQSNQWEDRSGQKRTSWEINAESVYFGESKKNASQGTAQNGAPAAKPHEGSDERPASAPSALHELSDDDDGELPF